METGLIGLPLAGKTTIFNALTGLGIEPSTHIGGEKSTNLSEVKVPDERLDRLDELFSPKKKVHASILCKDLGIDFDVERGFSPASIGDMRALDAIVVVVRAFEGEEVIHPFDRIDPAADFNRVIESLVFADYELVDRRIDRLGREGKRSDREYVLLEKLSAKLGDNQMVGRDFLDPEEAKSIAGMALLTIKPILVVANTGEDGEHPPALDEAVAKYGIELFSIRGATEAEIAELDPEEQQGFLADLGLESSTKDRFIRHIYDNLNLMSFLTAGEDEVRAWTIPRGSTALKSAGKIHSDLERGFIRAEVISYADLMETGGFAEAKKAGKMRLEGKQYVVADGDVLTIRFNV